MSNDICSVFSDFYKNLYMSELPLSSDTEISMDAFLESLSLPQLTNEEINVLCIEIHVSEIMNTIDSLSSGKASGPDGLPVKVYKMFKITLAPLLNNMFKHSLMVKSLPSTLQLATITVIPKENKDPEDPASYRPISNQNTDSKILAKLLAHRLNTLIPRLVSPDQTGFIPGRQAYSNVRRLLGVMQYIKNRTKMHI